MSSEADSEWVVLTWPAVEVTRVTLGAAEVPPLLGGPVRHLGWLRAPVIHWRGEELVEEHTPGVGQLQEGEENSHKNLVPDRHNIYTDDVIVNKVEAKEMSFFVSIQQTKV